MISEFLFNINIMLFQLFTNFNCLIKILIRETFSIYNSVWFTKILITPIFDLDYYLPSFSDFQIENLFRVPDNNKIPVYHLVDLSFALLKNPQNIYHNNNNEEISNNKIDVDNIKEVTEKIIIDEKEAIKEDKIITENNGPNAIKRWWEKNMMKN